MGRKLFKTNTRFLLTQHILRPTADQTASSVIGRGCPTAGFRWCGIPMGIPAGLWQMSWYEITWGIPTSFYVGRPCDDMVHLRYISSRGHTFHLSPAVIVYFWAPHRPRMICLQRLWGAAANNSKTSDIRRVKTALFQRVTVRRAIVAVFSGRSEMSVYYCSLHCLSVHLLWTVVIDETVVQQSRIKSLHQSNGIRWNKNEDARTSPVVSTNRQLPNSLTNWRASLLIGPWDSHRNRDKYTLWWECKLIIITIITTIMIINLISMCAL